MSLFNYASQFLSSQLVGKSQHKLLHPPFTTTDRLLIILLSIIVHTILFYTLPVRPFDDTIENTAVTGTREKSGSTRKRRLIVRNYLVSTIHSLVAITGVTIWLCVYTSDFASIPRMYDGGVVGTGDEWHPALVCWSTGYFIYDLVAMIMYPQIASLGSYIHHVVICTAFCLTTFLGYMHPFHFFLLLEEFSTPALNAKTLFKSNHKIADACSILFALSFFTCRIGYGGYLFIRSCPNALPYLLQCYANGQYFVGLQVTTQIAAFLATRALNFYWMWLIAGKVYRAMYSKKKKRRKSSSASAMVVDSRQLDKQMMKDFQTYASSAVQQAKNLMAYGNGNSADGVNNKNKAKQSSKDE